MSLFVLITLCVSVVATFKAMEKFERRRREHLSSRHAAARQLGLSFSGPESTQAISGYLNGVPVRADFRREGRSAGDASSAVEKALFRAGGDGRIPGSLAARRESTFRSLGHLVNGPDEQVGDGRFDELVEISGMDAYVCAALSADARRQLWSLLEQGGEARQGMLSYECPTDSSHGADWLVQMLQFLSQLTQVLTVTSDTLHQRLAHNALSDISPGVRLKNLRFLADPSTATPRALVASTARALLSDGNDRVRLLAALQLGREGTPVLSELAANPEVETALRFEALRELGSEGAPGLEPLLAKLLGASPPELVCAALTIIAARRLDFFSAAVVGLAASEHERVRVAAATALGWLPANGAEPALIRLLSDSSSDVQRASAESLGAIGSVAAVEPLLPLAEGFGRALIRQAARGAIGRIQSRLGNAEAGSLSLADDHELAGAVAIADLPAAARVGEVSIVDDTIRGQDSMATHGSVAPSARRRTFLW